MQCDFCGKSDDAAKPKYGEKAGGWGLSCIQILGNKLRAFCDSRCRDSWVAMRPGSDKVWE